MTHLPTHREAAGQMPQRRNSHQGPGVLTGPGCRSVTLTVRQASKFWHVVCYRCAILQDRLREGCWGRPGFPAGASDDEGEEPCGGLLFGTSAADREPARHQA